jgi:long-subunit fatty acid transport protein
MESTVLNGVPDVTFSNDVVIPDSFAVGGSYRFAKGWLVTVEAERVEYSDQLEGYRSGVNYFTSGRVTDGSFATDPSVAVTYSVDDGTFLKAGVEYVFALGSSPGRQLALRAGWYQSPARQIQMEEFNSTDPQVNAMYQEAFPEGEGLSHVTGGIGVRLGSSLFELAGETSDGGSRIAASYVLTWGKKP